MSNSIAVVVGLCAHGLAISRALRKAAVHVIAVEANSALPGVRTNGAEVVMVDDINGSGLIDSLVSLASRWTKENPSVLFLTNDKMVRTVGEHYDRLSQSYRLSWRASRAEILPLLEKEHVYERCRRTELLHPLSKVIRSKRDIETAALQLRFPVILKPNQPISSYKTLLVEDEPTLRRHWNDIEESLPSIAQEFIPGDDSRIHFAALYLANGDVVARFEGKKLRSRPMGHTTVAISQADDEVHALARQFFDGLGLSGPVSLEIKKDSNSNAWVIEPTVGRSDFWVGLCIEDGIDFPLIEYRHGTRQDFSCGQQGNHTLWINEERDPWALIWLLFRFPRYLKRMRIVCVYLCLKDFRPFVSWSFSALKALPGRLVAKVSKTIRSFRDLRCVF